MIRPHDRYSDRLAVTEMALEHGREIDAAGLAQAHGVTKGVAAHRLLRLWKLGRCIRIRRGVYGKAQHNAIDLEVAALVNRYGQRQIIDAIARIA